MAKIPTYVGTAAGKVFVNIIYNEMVVKNVKEAEFANTMKEDIFVENAVVRVFANTT